ncbi:hypothetical protein E2320_005046, partial [Naja naja]
HLAVTPGCIFQKAVGEKDKKMARKLRFVGYEPDGTRKVVISRSASVVEQKNWNRVHANREVFMPMHSTSFTEGSSIIGDKR